MPATSAMVVEQDPPEGILLRDTDGPLLRLEVSFQCVWDGPKKFLAVERSKIHVFTCDGTQPLFRYEFDKRTSDRLPSAHIHFHGEHAELERAMSECGESTQRAKKRRNGKVKFGLPDLHFPVGGSRFRPALEDVMEMLIEEFGITPHGGQSVAAARKQLADARERWRRLQLATVVRDAPEVAAEALRSLDYEVISPAYGTRSDNVKMFRTI
ncbi:hypothetical protein [Nocardia arizonensis]|uniref:hypothetical protein n=1 Tax=Nocardia arizonensis TaxID=1141647 RepID=UPI0012E1D71D|nr:hypothetical protein [Nocardia arizonensis]